MRTSQAICCFVALTALCACTVDNPAGDGIAGDDLGRDAGQGVDGDGADDDSGNAPDDDATAEEVADAASDTAGDDAPGDVPDGTESCILVTDEAGVDFGAAYLGRITAQEMTISNCSPDRPLEVSGIRMVEGSDDEFYVDSLPGGLNDAPLTVEVGGTANFVLNYAPTAEAASAGKIEIRSNDLAKDPLIISVNGNGTNSVCPTAVAMGRVGDNPAGDQLEVLPLNTVALDASGSTDPDNPGPDGIREYEWTVVERPADSTSQFSPNNAVANPSFFVDLAGRYVIELTVYDDSNLASCEPARVTLLATPDEDIYIQLVWDTDGTDVDLHLLHPSGPVAGTRRPTTATGSTASPTGPISVLATTTRASTSMTSTVLAPRASTSTTPRTSCTAWERSTSPTTAAAPPTSLSAPGSAGSSRSSTATRA